MTATSISAAEPTGQDGPLTFWQIAVVALCMLANVFGAFCDTCLAASCA